MEIDVAIETAHAQTGFGGFTVVSGIELFLCKLRDQHAQPVQLRGSHETSKKPVKIFRMDNLPLRDIPQLRMGRQENRRRKFGEQAFRQVKIDVKSFESRKFLDLHLGKDLTADRVLDMRQPIESLWKHSLLLDVFRRQLGELVPCHA